MSEFKRINLRQLRALVAVARAGGFSRAARLLRLSQPALTVQIRTLEEALGLRLLDRNKRTVSVTPAGAELVRNLDRVLQDLDAVLANTSALAGRSRGSVAVATLPTVAATALPGVASRFRTLHPGIKLRIQDAVAQRVLSLVKSGDVDFGIGTMTRPDPELMFEKLATDDLRVIVPKDHAFNARRKPISLAELARERLILTTVDTSVRALVDEAFASIGQAPQPECESSYMSTAIAMVKAGLGVTILPASAMQMEGVEGLVARPVSYAGFRRQIGIVRRKAKALSPAAEAFLEELVAALAKPGLQVVKAS
jgi:DNA-binding transcriptional LysR family regulator